MDEIEYPREFTFFRKFGEAIGRLPRDLGDRLIVALIRYGAYGEEPVELSYPLDALFLLMRDDIGNSLSARARGKGGGRPPKAGGKAATGAARKPLATCHEESGESGRDDGMVEGIASATVTDAVQPMVADSIGLWGPNGNKSEFAHREELSATAAGKLEVAVESEARDFRSVEPEVQQVNDSGARESEKSEVSGNEKPRVSNNEKPKVSGKKKPNTVQYSTSQYKKSSIPQGVSGTDRSKRARIPTLEEMREYCRAKGYAINVDGLWARYDEAGWLDSDGRPIRNWQALCAACERNGSLPVAREAGLYAEYDRA